MNISHIKISQPCVQLEEIQIRYGDKGGERVDLESTMKKVNQVGSWAR